MHAYIYKMNFLVGLSYLIIYEVIIVSEPNKTHLRVSSIPPFIVTITTPIEYRCSLISRPDLFGNRKYIVATTFETSL